MRYKLISILLPVCSMMLSISAAETLKEAMFYQKINGNKVLCELCFRRCAIFEGNNGFCRVRKNVKGKLYSLVYGRPAGLQIDPIELEPMYHLIPGHKNLCVYTASCNFRCKHCHNWYITQSSFEELSHKKFTPKEVVDRAIKIGCKSISHSINEPTVFYEYVYDIAKEAKKRGLKNLFHTNGSISEKPLREILKYMDAVTVDLKAFNQKFYSEISQGELEHVLNTLRIIKEEGKHLEIVYLVIPTLNDDLDEIKRMCMWVKENLGRDVPLHFTRFFPNYKLTSLPPTPIERLEKARDIAISVGLKYVYIGNVPGHKGNSTYCPECKTLIIKRIHFEVVENKVKSDGRCFKCGAKIVGIWQ